jgi:RimJ/RimL family protein N-acetyltransferase
VQPISDGVVTLRAPQEGDARILVDGRDDESRRWLGAGDAEPRPAACIIVDQQIVGWIDHDADRTWLLAGEVNIGYQLFGAHRRCGFGTRAVQLLMHHLSLTQACSVATLLIDVRNERSQALAARAHFSRVDDLDGNAYFKRPVPPVWYGDDEVRVQFVHADAGIESGTTWAFDIVDADNSTVGWAECDLSGAHVPRGEAHVTYEVASIEQRGRAVRHIAAFLRDHTAAPRVHHVLPPGA